MAFLPIFVLSLLGLAYLEEGFWDGFVWREHTSVFWAFSWLPRVSEPATLTWLIPLLSLPQVTHYVLDGFIWKLRGENKEWKNILFGIANPRV